MGNFLTEIGNAVFMLISAYGVYYFVKWRANGISEGSKELVKALELIALAVGVRMGWWVFALHLSPEGATSHPWFVEWKWAITIPTAMVFSWGMLGLISIVEKIAFKKKVILFVAAFTIATIGSLI